MRKAENALGGEEQVWSWRHRRDPCDKRRIPTDLGRVVLGLHQHPPAHRYLEEGPEAGRHRRTAVQPVTAPLRRSHAARPLRRRRPP